MAENLFHEPTIQEQILEKRSNRRSRNRTLGITVLMAVLSMLSILVFFRVCTNNMEQNIKNSLMQSVEQRRLNVDFQKKYADNDELLKVLEVQEAFEQYLVMPFPLYSLTAEEAEQLNQMQMQLGNYVDSMMGRCIRGDVELNDETYAAFRKELTEKYSVEAFIDFWQKI